MDPILMLDHKVTEDTSDETLASSACAQATTDTQLIAFRAIQGTGSALLNPLSLSILGIVLERPPRDRLFVVTRM